MFLPTPSIDGGCNTRLKPITKITAHLDYLRFWAKNLTPERFGLLLDFVSAQNDTVPGQPWSPGGGSVWFENKLIGTYGLVGGFDVNDDGSIDCMVQLSGEYFEQLNLIDQWRLVVGLFNTWNVKCTRIDLAIDDPTYSVIPVNQMRESWFKGENFGFRNYDYYESGNSPSEMSKTHYFGSRNSGKLTRIYDHDGECMRHEVEFKRDFAQPIFEAIADIKRPILDEENPLESYAQEKEGEEADPLTKLLYENLTSYVVGAIDFRSRGNRKDASRAGYRDSIRRAFYQKYIDTLRAAFVRIKRSKPAKSLHKTLDWIKRQVSPSLAMLSQGLGRGHFQIWLRDLVMYGEEKIDKQKDLWVREMRANPRCVQI